MHGEDERDPDGSRRRPETDLTARARIRDAALELFTENGVEGTGIRDVAKRAGVSGGLVQHHFVTKAGLRSACDEFALAEIVRIKGEVIAGQVESPAFLTAAQPDLVRIYRYLARSMVDGSSGAAAMFHQMVLDTEAWLKENLAAIDDPQAFASLMVAMETGLLVMHGQLSRALGADVLSFPGSLRMSRAKVEFYSTALLTKEFAQRALESIDAIAGQVVGTQSPVPKRSTRRSPR